MVIGRRPPADSVLTAASAALRSNRWPAPITLFEECQNKGLIPAVVVPMGLEFISPVVKSTPPVVVQMEQNATVVNFTTPAVSYHRERMVEWGINLL